MICGPNDSYMGVNPKMVVITEEPWVFLLKMISTWGVKWGYHLPPFKETPT